MSEAVTLKEWLDNHHITYSLRKDVLVIPGFGRCLIQESYDHIFKQNKDGETVFNSIENISYLLADDITYIVFPFGCRWFYVDIRNDPLDLQFQILRYVGDSPVFEHKCEFYPLGIHSGYELLNGSGLLKDWCTKTKFLGYKGLSVADRNTMAASLDLQQSATEKGIKYCFGYSLTVNTGKDKVGVKIYSATQQGFKNMLRIQKAIAVDNIDTKEINLIDFLNLADGNILVFDKWSGHWLTDNKGILQDFITAFLLTFSNVLIVLLYIGLFARFGFVLPEHSVWMLSGGIAFIGVGAVLWWFGITYIVAKLKKWFNVRGIWLLNRIVGSVIIVLAIIGVLSVLLTSYLHLPLLQIYN
jgi:DNA polymerase-3 subunit alpha